MKRLISNILHPHTHFGQLARYLAVGTVGFFINLGVFTLSFHVLHMVSTLSACIAFVAGFANGYTMNRFWTFKHCGKKASATVHRYASISIFCLGLNLLFLALIAQALQPEVMAQALSLIHI